MFSTLLALAASISLSAAAPTAYTTGPPTAAVDWYQGQLSFEGDYLSTTAGSCGIKVASGSLTGDVCNNFKVLGLGIHQRADKTCKLKMWKDVTTCDGDGSWIEIVIPKGNQTTCIRTGVLDGGRFYKASGVYSCFD
ncbi:hypothetical protein BDZ85DRAFT_251816 [Elsinoe ampelina]|uniref:Uncharacterized protein n=1 Tax=Elsinoe ampelina TaxID=302913 RepID=A0A6A6G4L9_9PEZI|nr:hypothetical protein BDZ85DRAFT_251816 [Elsinoe ampelina]